MSDSQTDGVIRFQSDEFQYGMANIKTKGLILKESAYFTIGVRELGDAVELALCVCNMDPGAVLEEEFPFEVRIPASTLFGRRSVDVMSYLRAPLSTVDLTDFIPEVIEQIMRTEAELFLENGGFEVNAYLKLRDYEEMVSIDRETAKQYVMFEKS